MDNFSFDPLGGNSMTQTAENVARKRGISTVEQHEVVLRRLEQYRDALANGHAFQKRYMTLPFEVPNRSLKKIQQTIEGDEGIFESPPRAWPSSNLSFPEARSLLAARHTRPTAMPQ
jgi:acetyl-CoA acetyltransferase